ncbi:MAG: tetratricopeptide repeat protein [Planctomycetes bacterium]|nr:tetratricopeptide repeat protein [Planctomycetota bacterium]
MSARLGGSGSNTTATSSSVRPSAGSSRGTGSLGTGATRSGSSVQPSGARFGSGSTVKSTTGAPSSARRPAGSLGSTGVRGAGSATGSLGRSPSKLTRISPTSPVGKAVQGGYSGYASRVTPAYVGYGQSYPYGCNYGYGTWCPTTNWYGYGCAGWGPGWGYGLGIGLGWSSCNWSLWWGWSNCWYWGSRWGLGFGWGAWCGWGGWCAPAYACYYPAVVYAPVYDVIEEPATVVYADRVIVEEAPAAAGTAPMAVEPAPEAPAADPVLESRARELHSRELELAQKYVKLGDLYFRAQRYPAATDAYARAIELAPEDAALHFIQSDAQFAAGDYASAAASIRRALARDPELARMSADKTKIYEDPTHFSEQLGRLEGHVQRQPLDGDAFLVLGYNLAFSARAAEARSAFETSRRLQPSDPAAALFLAALIDRELEAAGTELK